MSYSLLKLANAGLQALHVCVVLMLGARCDYKVVVPVVVADAIQVVDDLVLSQLATESRFQQFVCARLRVSSRR
jgi:hypothetical protein